VDLDLPALIDAWGYPVTFVGTLLEGETILTLAGLAAHRGHLALLPLWLIGALGGWLGDNAFFALGRRYGADALARWPSFAPAIARVEHLILKSPALAVIAVRFLYGVRVAGPIVIGASPLPWRRYLLLNAGGALLWSAVWVTLGYLVGAAAERLLGNVARFERELFIGVLVVAIAAAVLYARRARGRRRAG
jgi:membrane protein DedA with SNARE-associated domain